MYLSISACLSVPLNICLTDLYLWISARLSCTSGYLYMASDCSVTFQALFCLWLLLPGRVILCNLDVWPALISGRRLAESPGTACITPTVRHDGSNCRDSHPPPSLPLPPSPPLCALLQQRRRWLQGRGDGLAHQEEWAALAARLWLRPAVRLHTERGMYFWRVTRWVSKPWYA